MQSEWILGLIGGGVIGLAGALFLLVNGRIMGASGLLGGVVDGSGSGNMVERLFFLGGLVGVPAVLAFLGGWIPDTEITGNLLIVIVAGLLVGTGTRLANGCTSGHGVCGISRLSLRGIVATVFYIAAGGLTIALFRHVLGVI